MAENVRYRTLEEETFQEEAPIAPKRASLVPTVFIGLGGTGRAVVARLKRLITERIAEREQVAFQYLALDTETYKKECQPLDDRREYLNLAGFRPAEAVDSDKLRDIVGDWWFTGERYGRFIPPYVAEGAGAIRAIGRLALFYHWPTVKGALDQVVGRALEYSVHNPSAAAGELNLYILASVAGGTGASMFLDVAHLAQHIPNVGQVTIYGVLFLPDVFTSSNAQAIPPEKQRWMANGYAALKELNYFNTPGNRRFFRPRYPSDTPPDRIVHPQIFNSCYLIQSWTTGSRQVTNQALLFDLIAESIYLHSAHQSGERQVARRVNFASQEGYSSIGIQMIAFPHEVLARYSTYRSLELFLAKYVPAEPGQVEAVIEELHKRLSAYQLDTLDKVMDYIRDSGEKHLPSVAVDPEGLKASPREVISRFTQMWKVHWTQFEELRRELNVRGERAFQRARQQLLEAARAAWDQNDGGAGRLRAFLAALQARLDTQLAELDEAIRAKRSVLGGGTATLRYDPHDELRKRLEEASRRFFAGRAVRNAVLAVANEASEYFHTEERVLMLEAARRMLDRLRAEVVAPLSRTLEDATNLIAPTEVERVRREARRQLEHFAAEELRNPHSAYTVSMHRGDVDFRRMHDLHEVPVEEIFRELAPKWWERLQAGVRAEEFARDLVGLVRDAFFTRYDEAYGRVSLLESLSKLGRPGDYQRLVDDAVQHCSAFWAYEKEQVQPQSLTIVALPADTGPWAEPFKRQINISPDIVVAGDDKQITILRVETGVALRNVSSLPNWMDAYRNALEQYYRGEDERPLHIHRDWSALDDIGEDANTRRRKDASFGVCLALGIVRQDAAHVWHLHVTVVDRDGQVPNVERLGLTLGEARSAFMRLSNHAFALVEREIEAAERAVPSPRELIQKYREVRDRLRADRPTVAETNRTALNQAVQDLEHRLWRLQQDSQLMP